MADFLLLYTGGMQPQSDDEMAKIMQAWTEWYGELGAALKDGGNPFTPAAKSVASDGSVSDGPIGVMATGYTIVSADSLEAASELARGCPVLTGGGGVTVYETFEVM
jgi:hypothetical protein